MRWIIFVTLVQNCTVLVILVVINNNPDTIRSANGESYQIKFCTKDTKIYRNPPFKIYHYKISIHFVYNATTKGYSYDIIIIVLIVLA